MTGLKKTFLIVAGGSGKRMLSGIPKQFLLLAGKPILMRTLEIFHRVDPSAEIVLVLPGNHFQRWRSICEEYHFHLPHMLVAGGDTRFQSVRNGLEKVDNEGLVAIHDGVRPLVTTTLIKKLIETAERLGNAVPGLTITESLRKLEKGNNYPVPRDEYMSIQTPQVFLASEIKEVANPIKIFPNPTKGEFILQLKLKETENYEVVIFDNMGKTIQKRALKNNEAQIALNMSDRPSGLYIIKVHTKDGKDYFEKLILIP